MRLHLTFEDGSTKTYHYGHVEVKPDEIQVGMFGDTLLLIIGGSALVTVERGGPSPSHLKIVTRLQIDDEPVEEEEDGGL